jgi:phytoene synthase
MAASAGAGSLAAPELEAARILARAQDENFVVAPRFLPRRAREALAAVYGFARLADEIGDAASGDRLALLDTLELELERAFAGAGRHPLLERLAPVLREHALPRAPFTRLIAANRWDQRHQAIRSFDELLDYCALSANPVGELVLHIFGQADARNVALSNRVCSALQVIEHCQDVAEDRAHGRTYLPAADLAELGCPTEDLARTPPSPALRRVLAHELGRARELLAAGSELVARLRGFARLAVAGYAAGGLATCDALERAGFDPASPRARRRRRDVARHAARLLLAGARS